MWPSRASRWLPAVPSAVMSTSRKVACRAIPRVCRRVPSSPIMDSSSHSPSSSAATLRRVLRVLTQIALLSAIWFAAKELVDLLSLPISAGVLGLLGVLALLLSGLISTRALKDGADRLTGELILFFIPSVVAVVKYAALLRATGVQILVSIIVGTLLVMVTTAWAVHWGCLVESRLRERGQAGAGD